MSESTTSAIERAVKVKALQQLALEIGVGEAVGVLAAMVDRDSARARQSRPPGPSRDHPR